MFATTRQTRNPRKADLRWVWTLCALLIFAAPAVGQQQTVSCWADCGDCWGWPWGWTEDCNLGGCIATGYTVACASGCCLDANMAMCWSFYQGQFYSMSIQCGILFPWVTDDPETLKLYREARTCLDIGVTPSPRADGHADWVLVEMDGVDQLTAGSARVRASSAGLQAVLPDLDPAVLALRMNEIQSEVNKMSLDQGHSALMVGVYPPLESRPIRLDVSHLDGRKVEVQSGEAFFEVEVTPKGRIRDVRALYWSDEEAFKSLLPLLQGTIGLRVEDVLRKGSDSVRSIHGLIYLVATEGAVQSTLSYGYELIQ